MAKDKETKAPGTTPDTAPNTTPDTTPDTNAAAKGKKVTKPKKTSLKFMASTGTPKIAAKAILKDADPELVKAIDEAQTDKGIAAASRAVLEAHYTKNKATVADDKATG